MCGTCVNLPKSASPLRIAENRPITNVQEVSVALVGRLVCYDCILPIAADVGESPRSRILEVASVDFLPQLRSARDQAKHLTANSNVAEFSRRSRAVEWHVRRASAPAHTPDSRC